jgi:pyruvate/2-oxoglutarate dehydrogenase complex dihydrolipoamide dehydrogenase (E3) component
MGTIQKPRKFSADVIVIGSGSGGSIAAQTLAQSGKKVIIIEESRFGGDCANYSCVPTRALLDAATTAQVIGSSSQFGIKASVKVDYEAVRHWAHKAVHATGVTVPHESVFSDENIHTVTGRAHFIDPYTVSVNLTRYTAAHFIIATGASPQIPKISGLADYPYRTYRTFLKDSKLPQSVAIIGGGSTGYEYSQIFSAFGTKTHLFESHYHLFANNDSEVGDLTESILTGNGVRVHTNAKVTSVQMVKKSTLIGFSQNGQDHHISVDGVFIATGSAPNTDCGLDNAHITYSNDGIRTNSRMQTSQKHIFAVGDVVANSVSASSASRQGQIAAHNILHRKKIRYDTTAVPSIAYGLPEVVTIGTSERAMKLTGLPYQSSIAPLGMVGKSFTSSYANGFVKIIATHTGVVTGASIVAPHASEFAGELTFAIQHHRRACDIANTLHPFSSWSDAVRVAASKIYCI